MYYVYTYFNPENDIPFYVGKGKQDRANTHHKGYSTNKQVAGRIRNLRANGIEPTLEITKTTNEVAAFWLERCLIKAFGRKDLGTGTLLNHTDGGEGCSGMVHTDETRDKLRRLNTGKKLSTDVRGKISASLKGRSKPPVSIESRARMSASKKGKVPWNKGTVGLQVAWNKGLRY